MITVMIVDDERIDRDAYQLMIEKNMPGLQIVAQADDGISAVEKSMAHKPDIILIDQKMPGLNGLDAIQVIRENSPEVRIIIISAYDYFEYAKSALSLGVESYLVKPVSETELIQALCSAVRGIEAERQTMQSKMKMLKTVSSMGPILNAGIMYAIRNDDAKTVELFSGVLNKDLSEGYVLVGVLRSKGKLPGDFCEYIQKNSMAVRAIGCVSPRVFLALVYGKEDFPGIEKAADELRSLGEKRFCVRLDCATSGRYRSTEEMHHHFFQAMLAVCAKGGSGRSGSATAQYDCLHSLKLEYRLMDLMLSGQRQESMGVLDQIIGGVSTVSGQDFEFVKLMLYGIYRKMARISRKLGEGDVLLRASESMDVYENLSGPGELRRFLFDIAADICGAADGAPYVSDHPKIAQILKYLAENYCDDIPLAKVAKHFYISPGYLGRLLQDATAMSYTEYIADLRIKKAKEMLSGTDWTVGQVSDEAGFHDPNYFTKVFKKYVGMTPKEFRKEKTHHPIKDGKS